MQGNTFAAFRDQDVDVVGGGIILPAVEAHGD